MDTCLKLLLCTILLSVVVVAAPPTRKSSYGKPSAHHDHHKDLNTRPDEGAWFNGQATEPPVEWPEEAEEPEEDEPQQPPQQQQHHNHHHHQQIQHQHHHHHSQTTTHDDEGSAGPWVGLSDGGAAWPEKKKVPWPSSYGGFKKNGNGNGNGKSKTTTAPTWPPKPLVPQGGWTDPSQGDDSLWPDTPAIQLHRKFHAKANKQKNTDDSLSGPQIPSWSDAPSKVAPWPSKTNGNGDSKLTSIGNGNGNANGNGKKNGNGHHHHSSSNKPAVVGWDQVPTGYAHKRPTWTKKKDHVIKFKESKFSQTDFTAPSDDNQNGGWVEEDEEEAGWQDEEPKPWPKKTNGGSVHHYSQKQKHHQTKSNGGGGPKSWSNGAAQVWPRGTAAKHSKWSATPDGEGAYIEAASPGNHHHHGSSGSSLNNGWLDLQKELYLLKNKVRVSSSNGAWPATAKEGNNNGWKQPWPQDQEPFSSATKMVTKVVFAESLPKGEKMVMRWTPPVSYQVTN